MKSGVACLVLLGALTALGMAIERLCLLEEDRTTEGLDLSGALCQLRIARRHAEELEDGLADARRLRAHKDEIALATADRRLTLLEAASHFRAMNERAPGFDHAVFRMTHSGDSDEERYCRAVIHWVSSCLTDRPAEAAEVAARLESELQKLLEREGTITLPPPAP